MLALRLLPALFIWFASGQSNDGGARGFYPDQLRRFDPTQYWQVKINDRHMRLDFRSQPNRLLTVLGLTNKIILQHVQSRAGITG